MPASVSIWRSQRNRFLRIWFSSAAPCKSLAACSFSLAARRISSVTSADSARASVSRIRASSRLPFLRGVKARRSDRRVVLRQAPRGCARPAGPPHSLWRDAATRHDRIRVKKSSTYFVARTFIASASRRSGLKSVRPELFTIRCTERLILCAASGASPSSGFVTSPSSTSTRARRNSANFSPWCSARGPKTGDSSTTR